MSAESQTCEASREPLNSSLNQPVVKQWLSSRHEKAATDTQEIRELVEVMFSVRSVPKLSDEVQLPLSARLILFSERMLHKDYDRKGSVAKEISGRDPQGA
jgi:hypothetical protein